MKKLWIVILASSLLALAACSAQEDGKESVESNKQDGEKVEETGGVLEVDEVSSNVEFTIASHLLAGADIDAIIVKAEEDGIDDVTKNDDGSLTYKMTQAKHEEMMQGMKDDLTELIENLLNGENYKSIQDIEYKEDFSEFTLTVDQEGFKYYGQDSVVARLGVGGLLYQIYNGTDVDELHVKVIKKNHETGKVFGTTVYPEGIEEGE